MPAKTSQSSLVKELGDLGKKSHEAHKADDVRMGFMDLPAGIKGGIAQLKSVTWGKYAPEAKLAGKPYVRFSASIVEPREHDGITVRGLLANLTMPLCPTGDGEKAKSFDQNYAEFLNELKKLGIQTVEFNQLDAVLEALQKAKPHTRFSTRGWTPPATKDEPKPTEMVFVSYGGVCQYNGQASAAPESHVTETSPPADGEDTPSPDPEETVDLAALLGAALDESDSVSEPAQIKIQEIALSAGVEQSAIDDASDWGEVVEMIKAKQGGTESADDGDWIQKDRTCLFKPFDKKAKKKAKAAVECLITAVDKAKGTCNLLKLEDRKTKYDNVPIAEIEKQD